MNWPLIDTHSHLYSKEFIADFPEVLERSQKMLQKVLLPNIDPTSADRMHWLVDQHPGFFVPMMGIHPCSVTSAWTTQLEWVKQQLAQRNDYCAIGEIGIDLYWDKDLLKEQTAAFAAQVELAKSKNLPIVIHARDSFEEIFQVLDELNSMDLRGVFHCFTGNLAQAEKVLNYGDFYLGVGGILTYKNSGLSEVFKNIALEHLILETDAPYLSPVPFRGKRNESSYLIHVAEKLAEILGLQLQEVAEKTTANAQTLFKLS